MAKRKVRHLSPETPLDALFPKLRQRILATFFLHPEKSWSSSELAKHLAVTPSSLSRELSNFENFQILECEQIGRMKRYKPNLASQVFPEIQGLVTKTIGIVGTLQTILNKHRKDINAAFIYGSIAKNEENSLSDIDLMIVGHLSLAEIARDLKSAEHVLMRPVNPTLYTPTEWHAQRLNQNNFIQNVMREKKLFLIGAEDDLV